MKEINKKIKYIISGVCLGILILFMVSIGIRFFTRQVLVKRMGIDNGFTRVVFFDNDLMSQTDDEKSKEGIDWTQLYPFEDNVNCDVTSNQNIALLKYQKKVSLLEGKINTYTRNLLVGQSVITEWHSVYNHFINWGLKASVDSENTPIIYMKNGYLTYQEPKVQGQDIEEIADSLKDFSDYLEEKDIPFLYVNAGSKVNPQDRELSALDYSLEYTNENGDALQQALDNRGVTYLDMRKEMLDADLDWYGSYYKTDHHWTSETQLWAAGVIANKLNEIADMDFDSQYFDNAFYDLTEYKNVMFGAQGEGVTRVNAKTENYTSIFPKCDTDFLVEIPTRSYCERGDYKTTLYDLELMEKTLNCQNGGNLYLTTSRT